MAEELVTATLDDDEEEELQSAASSGEVATAMIVRKVSILLCINQIWFSIIAQTRTSKPYPPKQ